LWCNCDWLKISVAHMWYTVYAARSTCISASCTRQFFWYLIFACWSHFHLVMTNIIFQHPVALISHSLTHFICTVNANTTFRFKCHLITFKIHKMSFVAMCFSLMRPSSGNYKWRKSWHTPDLEKPRTRSTTWTLYIKRACISRIRQHAVTAW
jgi:hypothetical protein